MHPEEGMAPKHQGGDLRVVDTSPYCEGCGKKGMAPPQGSSTNRADEFGRIQVMISFRLGRALDVAGGPTTGQPHPGPTCISTMKSHPQMRIRGNTNKRRKLRSSTQRGRGQYLYLGGWPEVKSVDVGYRSMDEAPNRLGVIVRGYFELSDGRGSGGWSRHGILQPFFSSRHPITLFAEYMNIRSRRATAQQTNEEIRKPGNE